MKLADLFREQLERESTSTRRMLERVPEGRNDWKPHEKSMPLGYLAALVAKLPAWVALMTLTEEYDLASADPRYHAPAAGSTAELVKMFDDAMAHAREALAGKDDAHFQKTWTLKVGGRVGSQQPRYVSIADAALSHLAHHRGQLSVYLRLLNVPVPSIYGPTADEKFGG
jgi:uncharacterized damage-inducible protein DinB